MINEHKKGVRAVKHTKKAKGIEPPKPRNYVAKNAKMGGAGAHADKKKDAKQGKVKHKKMSSYMEHLDSRLQQALVETTLQEEGLSPMKRLQIIQYLAKTMGYEVNYLELASDPELVDLYKQVKQEKGTVRKETMAGVGDMDNTGMNAVANEGWTHDTLAARLFQTENTYEERLQNMLAGKVAFMEGGIHDEVTMFSKPDGEMTKDKDLAKIHPSEFGDESEYGMEGDYVKNQIHTMMRVMKHLEHALGDDEDLPEWVEEKISNAKGMLVSVMDYIISEKERAIEKRTGKEGMMAEAANAAQQAAIAINMKKHGKKPKHASK